MDGGTFSWPCGTWHTDTTLSFSFLQQESPSQLPHPKGFLSQPWASRGAVLICGPLKEESLSKFQGVPEVESEVTVVPLSFLSEVVLLENISTELPFSFSSLRMEKIGMLETARKTETQREEGTDRPVIFGLETAYCSGKSEHILWSCRIGAGLWICT